MLNVCNGLVVYPKVIEQRVMQELPFMASENIMMSAVKKGGDRQQLTKAPGSLSGSGKNVKELGMDNDLIDRICSDESFQLDRGGDSGDSQTHQLCRPQCGAGGGTSLRR